MSLGNFGFAHPWLLLALPLALLPLWRRNATEARYPWVEMLPHDALSDGLARGLRVLGALGIAATTVALAGPYHADTRVERIAQGAEIVLLLDRSRSMDQPFAGDPNSNWWSTRSESKSKVARRLLSQFAARRAHDRIGVIVFSTLPIRIIPFTGRHELAQAAIGASDLGPGLAETDLGRGLLAALSYFQDRPYAGSRIILLVSDGGAEIEYEVGRQITQLMKRERVALCWLYLRSYGSPGLIANAKQAGGTQGTAPEHQLHEFFQSIGTPYRAYNAESPQALEQAIEDVNRLTSLPIRYSEVLPRTDRSRGAYVLALLCSVVLLAAKWLEVEQWH